MSAIKKNVFMLNNALSKQLNLFACKGKLKMIGSNSIRGMLFASDIDLECNIKNITPRHIVEYLRSALVHKKNTHLLEFKCGIDAHGQKLRWHSKDIIRGELHGVKLEDALLEKKVCKADLIVRVGNTFEECSINYYIKIGPRENFDKLTKNKIQEDLEADIQEYQHTNTLKSLKRLYSAMRLERPQNKPVLKRLEEFFNSSVGLLNKIKNDLEIVLKVLPLEPWNVVCQNLQVIKQNLASIYGVPANKLIALDYLKRETARVELEALVRYLMCKINDASKSFLHSL